MIKTLKNEIWKPVKFKKGIKPRNHYAVSNMGRVVSFEKKLEEGQLLTGTIIGGYNAISLRTGDVSQTHYVHKLVAQNFIEKKNPKQKFVIHIDHNKSNNKQKNLSWATYAEVGQNKANDPEHKKRIELKPSYSKLTNAKVKIIKTLLAKEKTTATAIAERFKISTMQIYRIKRGEVWKHVTI